MLPLLRLTLPVAWGFMYMYLCLNFLLLNFHLSENPGTSLKRLRIFYKHLSFWALSIFFLVFTTQFSSADRNNSSTWGLICYLISTCFNFINLLHLLGKYSSLMNNFGTFSVLWVLISFTWHHFQTCSNFSTTNFTLHLHDIYTLKWIHFRVFT